MVIKMSKKEYYIVTWASTKHKTYAYPVENILDLKMLSLSNEDQDLIISFTVPFYQYNDGVKYFRLENIADIEDHFGVSPIVGQIVIYDTYIE